MIGKREGGGKESSIIVPRFMTPYMKNIKNRRAKSGVGRKIVKISMVDWK